MSTACRIGQQLTEHLLNQEINELVHMLSAVGFLSPWALMIKIIKSDPRVA